MTKKVNHVRNWSKYNKALVARGSINLWINPQVVKNWYSSLKNSERGRPKYYTDIAIECCLFLRGLFKQSLRATQGLVESIFNLMGIKIKSPCYTQICRRQKELKIQLNHNVQGPIHVVVDGTGLKIYGEGEWKVRQHGYSKHRMWRKMHIGIDVNTQQIVMMELTDNRIGENKKLKSLLEQYKEGYTTIGGDKGYDSFECHEQVGAYGAISAINTQEIAKERKPSGDGKPLVRDEIVRRIAKVGKQQWKKETNYHKRSLVETAMFRYKTTLGSKMHARVIENQKVSEIVKVFKKVLM